MMRSKSQVFFNHLPGQLQRDTENKIISMIPATSDAVRGQPVKTAYDAKIMERAEQELRVRRALVAGQVFRSSDYDLQEVNFVKQQMLPLIFTCQRCSRAIVQEPKSFKTKPIRAKFLAWCFHCDQTKCGKDGHRNGRRFCRDLVQESLVVVHECGHLGQPNIIACKNPLCSTRELGFGRRHLTIKKGQSQQVKDMSWFCLNCKQKTGDFFIAHRDHGACDYNSMELEDGSMKPTPAQARPYQDPGVYRRIGFTIVNHGTDDIQKLKRDSGLARKLYEIHLGKRDLKDLASTSGTRSEKVFDKIETALNILVPDVTMDDLPDVVASNPDKIAPVREYCDTQEIDLDGFLGAAPESLNDLGLNDSLLERETARDVLLDYYQLVGGDYNTNTWSKWVQTAHDIPTYDLETLDRAQELLNALHFEDALYTPQLPIANVALGYERGRFAARKSFKFYPKREGQNQFPFYIHAIGTEAIIFKLRADKIVDWLIRRGHDMGQPVSLTDGRRILLNTLDHDAMSDIKNGDIEDPMSRDVYTLLHTMSHCLLKTINAHSSDDAGNMGEILLPAIPGFIIYLNKRTEFTSGGIEYLYQRHLPEWLADAMSQAKLCMNDPSCRFGEGAATCYGCTQGSEIGCSAFNQLIDRNVLWDFSAQGSLPGFWSND